jgi:hypothetical protein
MGNLCGPGTTKKATAGAASAKVSHLFKNTNHLLTIGNSNQERN